jgi:hypothetical protein
MVIGVDATCWANGRGYGRFARELMREMTRAAPDDRFTCFGDRRSFDAYPDPAPNVRLVEVAVDESPTIAASAGSNRSPRDLLRLTVRCGKTGRRVLLPVRLHVLPAATRLPAVVTIHDTIPERFRS